MDYLSLFIPNSLNELCLLYIAWILMVALPVVISRRFEVEKYCGPSEWRVGKVLRW